MAKRGLVTALLVMALAVTGWVAISAPTAPAARAGTLAPAAQWDLSGDRVADVVAVSSSGGLWLYPGKAGGGLGPGRELGRGWAGYDQVRVVGQFDGIGGTDLMARSRSTGALFLWPGNSGGGFAPARQIGHGWNAIRDLVAPGDWNGDGTADLVAVRSSDGTLWLYPGNGRGGFGSAGQIGHGWSGRDALLSAGDFDGDGATDLISRVVATGDLWLDRGNGRGGFDGSRSIGHGWSAMTAIAGAADANGDRRGDLLGRNAAGQLVLYRGNGSGGFSGTTLLGHGWSGMTTIGAASVRGDASLPAYSATVAAIDAATLARMRYSHRPGCPVAAADLRLLTLTYYGFDRIAHTGELVVHRTAATDITRAFGALYAARFPIQRMLLVDAYRGDDNASMAANNTSAYNCRTVAGSTSWSEHAYGLAIDVNPVHNPYVQGTTVSPPAGRAYLDRGNNRPGMIVKW